MTWTGWDKLRNVADERGIVYKRGDCSICPYVQAIDDLLIMKNATDVGLIFEDERGAQKKSSLFYDMINTKRGYSAQLVLLHVAHGISFEMSSSVKRISIKG